MVYTVVIFALVSALILIYFLGVSKKQNARRLFYKICALVLAAVFFVRYMYAPNAYRFITALKTTDESIINLPVPLVVISIIVLWVNLSTVLMLTLSPFFKIKIVDKLIAFVLLPFSLLSFVFFFSSSVMLEGSSAANTFNLRLVLYAIEVSLCVFLSFVHWWQNGKFAITKRELKSLLIIILPLLLATMPTHIPKLFVGEGALRTINDLNFSHRMFVYGSIITPVLIYLVLKSKDLMVRKYVLLFVSLSTLTTFSIDFLFPSFSNPAALPLHLCNTAMYIIPICLIFDVKKLFYFTYFINVLGAFLAILMPNYQNVAIGSPALIGFWVNHYIAFFMPLLIVALGIYSKPRLKEFLYSMTGFGIYFVIALVCNAWFSNYGHADYFFLNSDFIVSKLTKGFRKLMEVTVSFKIGGAELKFYPIYQILFFLVYCIFGLAMWFLYENSFMFAERVREMERLKNGIKLEELALLSQLGSRSRTEPLYLEDKDMIRIKNFSKQYGRSKVYAVNNVSLDIHAGEVFGFLGPNGAGKSTIIKSLVGIQSITKGKIEICGYDIERQSVEAKMNIGFVPDHYALYERLTGREYINYIADLYNVSKQDRDERMARYTAIFELTAAFDSQMRTYSHGMKQKIAIIAALIHNPKVWILDEPLTGLDPNSIYQVKETMKEHAKAGNIVFFSSHIMDVVERLCDRFAVIKFGNIIATHKMSEVVEQGITLEDYYLSLIDSTHATAKPTSEDITYASLKNREQ